MMQVDVASRSDKAVVADCPVLDGPAAAQQAACVKASNVLSLAILEFLKRKTPVEQAAWLSLSVRKAGEVFQPWSMEILFVVATLGRARFGELQGLLGISSRTLSDKLKTLRDAGLLDREVFDEHPVRIEYFLTKHGRTTAALATPLFAQLNLEALRAARR